VGVGLVSGGAAHPPGEGSPSPLPSPEPTEVAVEIDGSQHAEQRRAYDERRTAWLQSQGYRVLRFWNNDVLRTPRSVGEAILAAAAPDNDPTPDPSPQGGGERACASGEDLYR